MVYTLNYDAPKIDRGEVLRYLGVKGKAPELEALLDSCIEEIGGKLVYRVCYREFDISTYEDTIDLGFVETVSKDLRRNMRDCHSIVLFAATVGIEIDRAIARYTKISPSRALMLQAIGNERVESLCNVFNREISEQKGRTRPRFSPGYGDLSLELQRDIFAVLDCPKMIGVTLNESLLMSPSKSVTAIIGVSK